MVLSKYELPDGANNTHAQLQLASARRVGRIALGHASALLSVWCIESTRPATTFILCVGIPFQRGCNVRVQVPWRVTRELESTYLLLGDTRLDEAPPHDRTQAFGATAHVRAQRRGGNVTGFPLGPLEMAKQILFAFQQF